MLELRIRPRAAGGQSSWLTADGQTLTVTRTLPGPRLPAAGAARPGADPLDARSSQPAAPIAPPGT